MPDDNRISAEITAAVKTQVLAKLSEIFDLLTMLVNLTPEDKRSIPTIGTARAGMVEAFMQQMTAHPELVPSYVNMTELVSDRKLFSDLNELGSRANELSEALSDTAHIAGSDMHLAFLAFWNNVKEAQRRNVLGADAIFQDLRPFFARGTVTPVQPTPPGPGPNP